MRHLPFLFAIALTANLAAADARPLASIDLGRIRELAMDVLMAQPANQQQRDEARKLDEQIDALSVQRDHAPDDAARGELEHRIEALHHRHEEIIQDYERQAQRLILVTVKELAGERFAAVIDGSHDDAVITKTCDLVDLTVDVREKLLLALPKPNF